MANDVSAGADGLLFIPHLAGERLSHIALPSDGAFLGLKLHHRPAHLVRAVMEGVIFAMKEQLILLEAEDVQMTISGGVTKSQLWRQIQADVYDRILLVNDSNANHAAIGAALIAGIGCGIYQSFADACSRLPKLMQFVEPNPAHVSIYRDCFAHYVSLYQGIKMLKS
jgi:xylulokinase